MLPSEIQGSEALTPLHQLNLSVSPGENGFFDDFERCLRLESWLIETLEEP